MRLTPEQVEDYKRIKDLDDGEIGDLFDTIDALQAENDDLRDIITQLAKKGDLGIVRYEGLASCLHCEIELTKESKYQRFRHAQDCPVTHALNVAFPKQAALDATKEVKDVD